MKTNIKENMKMYCFVREILNLKWKTLFGNNYVCISFYNKNSL